MSADRRQAFAPRKQPVQARSEETVAILFEACVQVLLAVGYERLTTTRVAERAGVSVGTLYQYFPNRRALMAAVVERYLEGITAEIEADCQTLKGRPLDDIATGLVDAFIQAKWRRLDVARAMHEPLADVGGEALVQAALSRGIAVVAAMLSTASDATFDEVQSLSRYVVTACSALLRDTVGDRAGATDATELRAHMRALVSGYLREMRHA